MDYQQQKAGCIAAQNAATASAVSVIDRDQPIAFS
jgi:hypothetical protein